MSVCKIEEGDAGRSVPRTCPTCKLSGTCHKGLDRKAQAAEIARLRAALDAAESRAQDATLDALAAQGQAAEAHEARLKAEAERDAARLALQGAASYGCTCDPAYTDRGLAAPDCMANLVSDDAREALGLPRVCKGTAAIRAMIEQEDKG